MTSCSQRLLALRLVASLTKPDLGIRGKDGRSWACAGVSAQNCSQNAQVRKPRRSANFEKESPREFLMIAHLSLVGCTAFVVRTGPRFRLTPSVSLIPLMTSCANVHNNPIHHQLLVSAWTFNTCGFARSAGGGDDCQVCAEVSKSSRLKIERWYVDPRCNCARDG